MAYLTSEEKTQAAMKSYLAKKGKTLPSSNSSANNKTYLTSEEKTQAAMQSYLAKKKERLATETKKAVSGQQETKKQSDIQAARTEAARDRRDQERLAFNPILAAKEKLTYDEQQTKTARDYSSIAQMTGGSPVSLADRKFFTVNTAPRKLNPNIDMRATDEEIKVAKYYYEKAIADGATKEDKQNWKDIKNYIANRAAEREAERLTDKSDESKTGLYSLSAPAIQNIKKETPPIVNKAALAFNAGVSEGIAAPIKAIGTITGNTRLRDNAYVIANQLEQQDSGKLERLALGAVESIGRMLPSQLVGMATDPIAASAIMGLGSAQSAFEDAIKDGATQGKALAYGAIVGAAEGVLGHFLGGIPGIKKGSGKILDAASEGVEGVAKSAIKKVFPKLVSTLDNVAAKIIKNPALRSAIGEYVSSMGSEFVEESLQDILENHLQKALLDKEDVSLVDMETLESGIMGAIVAGFLGVPSVGTNISKPSSTVNTPKIETSTPKPEIKAPTETAPEATVEATPRVTDEALKKFYADAEKNKPRTAARSAIHELYTTGKINAKGVDNIANNKDAKIEFEIVFDTKLSDNKTEARQQIRAVEREYNAKIRNSAFQQLFAKIENGTATAEEIRSTKDFAKAIEEEVARIENAIAKLEATNPELAEQLRNGERRSKLLGIGLQFFGAPKSGNTTETAAEPVSAVAETATPTTSANAPATASVEAQENETPVTKQTTATKTNVPTEPVNAQESTTEETTATTENQPYKRPKGDDKVGYSKFGETAINKGDLSDESVESLKKAYENGNQFTYAKKTNASETKAAVDAYNTITDNGKNFSAIVDHFKNIANRSQLLSGEEGALFVHAMNEANKRGKFQDLVDITSIYSNLMSINGQFIQTGSLIIKKSPAGVKNEVDKELAKAKREAKAAMANETVRERHAREEKIEGRKKVLKKTQAQLGTLAENITASADGDIAELNNEIRAYKDLDGAKKRLGSIEEKLGKMSAAEKEELIAKLTEERNAYQDVEGAKRKVEYIEKRLGKMTDEEKAFWLDELKKELSGYKDIENTQKKVAKLEGKLGKMSADERAFWLEQLESERLEYRSIMKSQARLNEIIKKTGKMSADERAKKIEDLSEEIYEYTHIKKLTSSVAKLEEAIGKMTEDERKWKIHENVRKLEQYRRLRGQARKLNEFAKAHGNMSRAELEAKIAAGQQALEKISEYNEILRKYAKEHDRAKKLVNKELALQLDINRLSGNPAVSDFVQFEIASAKNEEELMRARELAYQEIGAQSRLNALDWLDNLSYGSMLGSTLRFFRDIVSNSANFVKHNIAVAASSLPEKLIPQERRVSAVINPASAKDRALTEFAKNKYKSVEAEFKAEGGIESASVLINRYKTTGNKTVDFLLKDSWQKPMEWGDAPYLRKHFVLTFAQICKARGINPNTATEEQLADITARAIYTAKEQTYKLTSETVKAISRFEASARKRILDKDLPTKQRVSGALTYAATKGTMPFKGVPANIMKQGVVTDTPIGLASAVIDAYKGGQVNGEHIQRMCKGLTGASIMVLGGYLRALGLIHLSGDDDESAYLAQLGHRSSSIDIGEYNITSSWLGSIAIPLFLGASIYDAFKDGFEFSEIANVISSIAQPIIDSTMLKGINDWIDTTSYNGKEGFIVEPFANYVTAFAPAIFNAINKTFIDPNRRSSVTAKTSGGAESVVLYNWNSMKSRIPGLSYTLPVWVDMWGREEDTGNLGKRAWDNWLDVFNIKRTTDTPVDIELQRLLYYEEDGVKLSRMNVLPNTSNVKEVSGTATDGTNNHKVFTEEEIMEYRKVRGATAYDTLEDMINTNAYKDLDDDIKALAVSEAKSYAEAYAKINFIEKKTDNWVLKAYVGLGGLSVEEVCLCRAVVKDAGASKKQDVFKVLNEANLPAEKYWSYYASPTNAAENEFDNKLAKTNIETASGTIRLSNCKTVKTEDKE